MFYEMCDQMSDFSGSTMNIKHYLHKVICSINNFSKLSLLQNIKTGDYTFLISLAYVTWH